jgi:DNA processing protein
MIYDRPPFLFVRGELRASDDRAVAVVGTRKPSPAGLEQSAKLASGLAQAGVTVVSGLAEGVDTAAHRAAIDAGGRTVAVLGHGILHPTYPKSNTDLAAQIAGGHGALVSQFWPTAPPTRNSFPIRNVTTSGLSVGTVVIEAGETSGARQQARKCLEHAKQLFLTKDLVTHQAWARRYAERPGVVVIGDVDEVLSRLDLLLPQPKPVQLTLA